MWRNSKINSVWFGHQNCWIRSSGFAFWIQTELFLWMCTSIQIFKISFKSIQFHLIFKLSLLRNSVKSGYALKSSSKSSINTALELIMWNTVYFFQKSSYIKKQNILDEILYLQSMLQYMWDLPMQTYVQLKL